MDEQTGDIIRKKLQKLGNVRLGKEHLKELREEISRGTGHNQFASFKNIRKWVSMVKKGMKKERKDETPPPKKERAAPAKKESEELMPELSERVFIQTVGYEIAGIRRSMDRISSQLDDIEKKLATKKEG
ncbi:MAG: hypothetical protein ABIF01_00660 [Candidatus Micrarchaeota archaeon]